MSGSILDIFLFVVLPYAATAIFFIGTIRRYRTQPFSYSSLSSQFLENKKHFWGLVPFHYGLIVILTGHLIGFLIPRTVLWWNRVPARLYILEISALIFGLLTLIGLIQIIYRRFSSQRVLVVTSVMDWVLYVLLLIQIVLGLYTAVAYPWGSTWFAALAAPYLWSLCKFSPDVSFVAPLPWMFKAHIVGAYALIAIFPFTRLVHLLVYPLPYVWRKPQVVRWYSRPEGIR
ncbi:MAG: respiratory nitrate reductase subunit gamma [Phycisphaerales bacterium]|jgi:nitrate reductase gamma subunit|nr:respiratory nitrate reductase subunit gamma [Phycisphaerales bacterium]